MAMFDAGPDRRWTMRGDGDFVFANFVDFDTEFGHRRDVPGYAAALEAFDRAFPKRLTKLHPGDMLVLTADHGNATLPGAAPTTHASAFPMLGTGPRLQSWLRSAFAQAMPTSAPRSREHLGIAGGAAHGTSFLDLIRPDA
jgi:phosphopentomutase